MELAKKLQWRRTVEFSAHNDEKFLQKQRYNEARVTLTRMATVNINSEDAEKLGH